MNLVRFQKPVYHATVNDLFNEFFNDYKYAANRTVACSTPAVNVLEDEKNYSLEFAVAGYSKEQFSVKNDNGILTVKADVQENENEKYTFKRFSVSSFERRFTIPDDVNTEEIKAKYNNGILTVELPKKEQVVEETKIDIPVE